LAASLLLILPFAACQAADDKTAVSPTTVSSAPSTSPPAATFPAAALAIVGPAEVVFDWSRDRCDETDIPDLPARAFRDSTGQVQVIAAHETNRRFLGADLNHISRDCRVVMHSATDAQPSRYADRSWLAAPYTEDGKTIVALVHNEYHGHEHAGMCPQADYFPCWYNSITLAVSDDGGASYAPAAAPPEHLVATLPQRYVAGAGPSGVFEPSNIIKGRDGFYYVFVRIDETSSDQQRICLMRTTTVADPASWRAYDGNGFTIAFVDPYREPESTTVPCAAIDPNHLGAMASSVTFNTYLNQYLIVGTTAVHIDGREVWGVLYALSDDLIHWQSRRLLVEVEMPWTYQPGDANVYLYPALLDPASPDRNFETTGKTAFVYLTRFNTRESGNTLGTLNRDLVRIPVELFPTAAQAQAAAVPFQP
jgi:hypothetical protein